MVGQLRQPLQTRSEVAVGSEDSNSLSPHVVSGMQNRAETGPVVWSAHRPSRYSLDGQLTQSQDSELAATAVLPAGQASQYRSWKRGRKWRMVALKSARRFTSFWLMEHLKPQIGHNIGFHAPTSP